MAIGAGVNAGAGDAARHAGGKTKGRRGGEAGAGGGKSGSPGSGSPEGGKIEGGGGKIAGGKNRVVQIRKPRAKEWTETKQAAFLAELAMTGNVTTSVAAVDMSVGGAYNRRTRDPAFAAGWQAALLRGYERLEQLLLATTLAALDRGGRTIGDDGGDDDGDDGGHGGGDGGGDDGGEHDEGGGNGTEAGADTACDAGDDTVDAPARGTLRKRGQAVPGAGLIQLSSVTAIQFALTMLNQHRADLARGRKRNQIHRATSAETDAALTKLLDSLARRMAQGS